MMINPDSLLAELREASKDAVAHGNLDAAMLGQKFLALDGSLTRHGTLPEEWAVLVPR